MCHVAWLASPELRAQAGKGAKPWMVYFLRGKAASCDLSGERTHDPCAGAPSGPFLDRLLCRALAWRKGPCRFFTRPDRRAHHWRPSSRPNAT